MFNLAVYATKDPCYVTGAYGINFKGTVVLDKLLSYKAVPRKRTPRAQRHVTVWEKKSKEKQKTKTNKDSVPGGKICLTCRNRQV